MNGGGYPYHIPEHELVEQDRVMAICDVYQALTEERPYRKSLPQEEVWRLIDGMADNGHSDGSFVQRLKKVFL